MTCLRLFRTAYYNMYIDLFVLFVAEVGHIYNTCPYLWWGSLLLTNGIKEASKSSDLQYGISAQRSRPASILSLQTLPALHTQPPDSTSSPYSVFALTFYNLKNLTSILFTFTNTYTIYTIPQTLMIYVIHLTLWKYKSYFLQPNMASSNTQKPEAITQEVYIWRHLWLQPQKSKKNKSIYLS